MEKQSGIVLKTFFAKKMKIVMLDAQIGKIEAVPTSHELGIGSLLCYYRQQRGHLYFLQSVELFDIPLMLAKEDILFLHHVLEICYFCAPFSGISPEIFAVVHTLYQEQRAPYTAEFKIAFLFKLLILLGMSAQKPQLQDAFYYLLARESIDTIIDKSIHLDINNALYNWVYDCVQSHPLIHIFKTVHFLNTV